MGDRCSDRIPLSQAVGDRSLKRWVTAERKQKVVGYRYFKRDDVNDDVDDDDRGRAREIARFACRQFPYLSSDERRPLGELG